jgi:uncharacterized protein YxeA
MMKKIFCLLSALLLMVLIAGCGSGKIRTGPSAEEIRRQQEEADMMQDAKESIQRMRDQDTSQFPAPVPTQPDG